jgi:CRISPR-associated protein Cas1
MELILNNYGASLNCENDALVITNNDGKQRLPLDGIRSISISKGARISSDAVMLAIEKEIEIVFIDKSGHPVGRVWSPKYGSISTIRKGQLIFTQSSAALDWIKSVLSRKIENQQALLLMFRLDEEASRNRVERAISQLEKFRTKIEKAEGETVSDVAVHLRGCEGQAAQIYFNAINAVIPEVYRFEKRSQHPAMDIFNLLLNYGYGVLYRNVESALIKSGIDPYIGVLHRDEYNRPVLVYDVIELYRVWVDYVVVSFISQNVITDDYYSVREDGSYWLEPLGRRILIQALNDYLEETIDVRGVTRSRRQQMFLYAQELAQLLKGCR